jgi:hypothetical protein
MPSTKLIPCEPPMVSLESASKSGSLSAHLALRRALRLASVTLYAIALFLGYDFAYSSLTRGEETQRAARIANPVYNHGFAANFDGYDNWGELRYRLITNSLGFKDALVRDVPLKSASRRVLLMGRSYTEGIGMSFEESFAGMLAGAGQERSEKIEFFNAAVASYSPVIYFQKIKYLLDSGFQFDEVVVFSDTADVTEEASSYFCIDDDPKYRAYCSLAEGSQQQVDSPKTNFLIDRFVVTNRVRIAVKHLIQTYLGNRRRSIDTDRSRIGWVFPGLEITKEYAPLGVEGGIARSLQNMRALSDLLARRNIPLTIVVYPWAQQVAQGDRDSRQVALWREFCRDRCKAFINLYPAYFERAAADRNWYEHLYILGDDHLSAVGNRFFFEEIRKYLLP